MQVSNAKYTSEVYLGSGDCGLFRVVCRNNIYATKIILSYQVFRIRYFALYFVLCLSSINGRIITRTTHAHTYCMHLFSAINNTILLVMLFKFRIRHRF